MVEPLMPHAIDSCVLEPAPFIGVCAFVEQQRGHFVVRRADSGDQRCLKRRERVA
jgi:hypothetical protein